MIDRARYFEFRSEHGLESGGARHHALRDGDLWFTEVEPDRWAISFYPHRPDHPDAPRLVTDSAREGIDGSGGADAVGERLAAHFQGRDSRELVSVLIEMEATAAEVEAVRRAFDEAGAPAIVRAGYGRNSAEQLPWVILLSAPLAALVTGFLSKAGADGWDALKNLVQRIYKERRALGGRDGAIQVDEGDRQIILTENITDEGYRAIASLPPGGYYVWDETRGGWQRSP